MIAKGDMMGQDFWSAEWDPTAHELLRRVKEQAAALGDDYLGTEHLLLAAVAVTPAERHGVTKLTLGLIRAAILQVAPRERDIFMITRWSQTPRLKLAIRRAMRRAFREYRPVSCRDLRYGLLADPESKCSAVLRHLGIEIPTLNHALE